MNRKAGCGAWSAVATLEDGSLLAVPITCRSWDCPHCAHALKRRLLRRLQFARPNLFATLTTSEHTAPSADEAFRIANDAVSSLIKRWRRKFPAQSVDYFLVWERTKRGWPHAHLLLRATRVSKHWLSHTWHELTGSYIIDLQQVSSTTHAASYLAKYLAKDPAVPPGFRRWRRSAGFFLAREEHHPIPLKAGTRWQREPLSLKLLAYQYVHQGLAIQFTLDGHLTACSDPSKRTALMASNLWTHIVEHVQNVAPGLLRPQDEPSFPQTEPEAWRGGA